MIWPVQNMWVNRKAHTTHRVTAKPDQRSKGVACIDACTTGCSGGRSYGFGLRPGEQIA